MGDVVEIAETPVRDWNFPRGAGSVLLMTRFASEHGIRASDMLSGTALSAAALADPDVQLDAHTELAVVRNLVRLLGHLPALGLRLGARYQVTTFGIFGFACVSSPTPRAVISFALRYWDLSFAFGVPAVDVVGDEVRVELRDHDVPTEVRQVLVERDLAAMYTILSDLLGTPISLRHMEFRFPEPPDVAAFVDVFGIRPAFRAPANLSIFDAAYLDRPLPKADAQTVALCEAQCRDLLARRRSRTGIAHEVRERLVRLGGAGMAMDDLARELDMSVRTLRRKLDAAGTSYRQLLDEVRLALAEELLATGALSVSDVAIRLGYAEASPFIAAFKRWKGVTPAAFLRVRRRPSLR